MPDDALEFDNAADADAFWAWLQASGELAALNAMLAGLPDEPAPGRNDPCYCGSGLKHKKCCGR